MIFNIYQRKIIVFILLSFFITGCSIEPKAFTKDEIIEASSKDLILIDEVQSIQKPLSLEDAIERGIQFNRDKRVKIMQTALAHNQLDLLKYDLLPELAANAGYSVRDNYAASSNAIFENGEPAGSGSSTVYSVAQEKRQTSADMTFSWNILDFGLSYVRAEQQSDRYLITKEQTRKVKHNITQEIRRAYYQAVTSQELLKRIRPLMIEVRKALQDSDKVKSLRLKSPMEALTYERELLDVLRDLSHLQKTLISAKIELTELIGLKPGTKFELSQKVQSSYAIPEVSFKLSTMEKIALENRPEILESRYKQRISGQELTIAKLKMLPSISIDAGTSYNSNDYLLNNNWNAIGANVSWNLFNIFKYSAMNDTAETQIALAKERKLALCLTVITQVHLSRVRYTQAISQYKLAKEYLIVSEEIYIQASNANSLQMNSKLVVIKEKLSYLLATLRHSSAHANMQNSYGRIYASLGIFKDSDVSYKKDMPTHLEIKKLEEEKLQEANRLAKIALIEEADRVIQKEKFLKQAHETEVKRLEALHALIETKRIEEEKREIAQERHVKEEKRLAKIAALVAIQKIEQEKQDVQNKRIEEMNEVYRAKQRKEIQKIHDISSVEGLTNKLNELKKDLQRIKLQKMKEQLNLLKKQHLTLVQVKPTPKKRTMIQASHTNLLHPGDSLIIGSKTHIVKKGEELWQISKDYNYKMASIIRSNPWLSK